jgi:hypothetical protein
MEEKMTKGRLQKRLVALVLLLAVLGMSSLQARVVATETLTIHAYIPQRTTVSFTETGEVSFSSNVPTAQVAVAEFDTSTLLSVTAL